MATSPDGGVAALFDEMLFGEEPPSTDQPEPTQEPEPSEEIEFEPLRLFVDDAQALADDEAAGFVPSPDQAEALAKLQAALEHPGEAVFVGAAGTGKTTCVRALLRRLTPAWTIRLLAPTWRAALRLGQVTERKATTVHRAIYGKPVEERRCECGAWSAALMEPQDAPVTVDDVEVVLPRYVCAECSGVYADGSRWPTRLTFELREEGFTEAPAAAELVVVDEAGMLAPATCRDLRKAFGNDRTRILFVGDANQLSWVSDGSDDAQGGVDLLHPTAMLDQVHRQTGDSGALTLAHTLKTVPEVSQVQWPFPRQVRGVDIEIRVPLDAPARWAADARRRGADSALIAFSNRTRAALNHLVRHYSGAAAWAAHHGVAVIPGDQLLVRSNSGAVFNGEVWQVRSVATYQPGWLKEDGRPPLQRTRYGEDRVLEQGVVVMRADLVQVGSGRSTWATVVCPRGTHGLPLFESDLIAAGTPPEVARQRCRDVAAAWMKEMSKALMDGTAAWEKESVADQDRRVARARLQQAPDERAVKVALSRLSRLYMRDVTMAPGQTPADVLAGLSHRFDGAADCSSVDVFFARYLGAPNVRTEPVAVVDWGEALTGHAMQGSEAREVGVVVDGAFYGAWKHDRVGALKWIYTAVTRTSADLTLFGIARA